MKLTDLGTGYIVTFRNGFTAMCYKNVPRSRSKLLIVNKKLGISIPDSEYTGDMKHNCTSEYDIVKVEEITNPFDLQTMVDEIQNKGVVWTRPVTKRILESELKKTFDCEEYVIVKGE